MSSKKDKFYLNLALNLAKQNEGLTGDNPSVGCIIVNKNKIISLGKTSINGRPHAENNAIKLASPKDLKNSTLYVTLEPCTHYGQTPPCTKLIIEKKITKIVFSSNDIDPRTANKLRAVLKQKNIKIKQVKLNNIDKFYNSYFYIRKNKKPFVTAKIGCSKDNFIYSKKNKHITNELSRNVSHILRYKNQGIIVSSKTLNKDNPLLSCRINGLQRFSPVKIILDKNLSFKKNLKIFKQNTKNIIFFYNIFKKKKISFLKNKKIKFFKCSLDNQGNLDFSKILIKLYNLKINYVLIEGGKILTSSLIKNKRVNQFFLFKSNKNLNKNGQININKILKSLNKNFKFKKTINTNLNGEKIINYFNYV
tara:strand:+ start:21 stop:1112 length:1092 start_codon:yes stop_codon:yes gene_type:complete